MATQNLGRVVGSKIYAGNATTNAAIATDLASRSITPLIYDLYFSANKDVFQYQLVETNPTWVLLMNIKGDAGTFAISRTYSSVAAMNAGYSTDGVPIGGLVVIDSNVSDPDNAKLYVKGDSQYNFLTDMSGAQGIQGPQGVKGDTGNTGASGATFTPSVAANGDISWTNDKGLSNPSTVNIKGPQGIQGETGATGATGATPVISAAATIDANTGTPSVSVTKTGTDAAPVLTFNFTNLKGAKGDTGNTGAAGADGITPTLSINSNGELIATYAEPDEDDTPPEDLPF